MLDREERARLERELTDPRWLDSKDMRAARDLLAADDEVRALAARVEALEAPPAYVPRISGDESDEELFLLGLLEECWEALEALGGDETLRRRVLGVLNGEVTK